MREMNIDVLPYTVAKICSFRWGNSKKELI